MSTIDDPSKIFIFTQKSVYRKCVGRSIVIIQNRVMLPDIWTFFDERAVVKIPKCECTMHGWPFCFGGTDLNRVVSFI